MRLSEVRRPSLNGEGTTRGGREEEGGEGALDLGMGHMQGGPSGNF